MNPPTENRRSRQQEEKARYNANLARCPSRQLLARISDKWAVLLIVELGKGPHRYSELHTAVAGVSQKMLTQTLRTLERDGLIDRQVTPSVPPRVDYELTPLGQSLLCPISVIKEWAEHHMHEIETAREHYDRRRGPARRV